MMIKFKYPLFCLLLSTAFGCTKDIAIQRIESERPVVVKMNPSIEKVVGIMLPFNLEINNNAIRKEEFIKIDYEYNFRKKGAGIELYEKNNRISNNELKVIRGKQRVSYMVYSRHIFDTTALIHQQLQPYLDKMLERGQDTLHIGTVIEFKEKHSELFDMLTKNDSISIRFLDKKNERSLGIRTAVPANW